ncbi:MAG: NAD(P)-dependent alcohol dehydrogenase [Micropepsaceae bacterium]
MKAYRLDDFQSLADLRLHDEAEPRPQRGEVLVRVHAVSLNYRDIAMVKGRYPRAHRHGLIPTSDGAGEIIAVGEGVEAFKAGDRVIGAFHPRWFAGPMHATMGQEAYGDQNDGWLVERKVLPQDAVVKFGDALSYEEAATLPCAGLTAWTALSGPQPIRAGHSVLVQGTGGVSIFALQLARAVGARVIATTSSLAKAERLLALGASDVVNYVETPAWGARVRALANGRGVDRVVEVGGPGTINQSLRAVAPGGEIASIGFLTEDNPGIDFFALKLSSASIRNIAVGDRAGLQELVRVVDGAGVKPIVDRVFPFGQAREAFAYLETGAHFGKVAIRVV